MGKAGVGAASFIIPENKANIPTQAEISSCQNALLLRPVFTSRSMRLRGPLSTRFSSWGYPLIALKTERPEYGIIIITGIIWHFCLIRPGTISERFAMPDDVLLRLRGTDCVGID